jgi:VWFA-related protein
MLHSVRQRRERFLMRSQIAVSAAFLVLTSSAGIPAQQPQQPVFRSKTDLIIIDAVVVDENGNSVRGLKAADFALTDRKKPQRIETFEEVWHQRPAGTAASAAQLLPPTLKLDVASNMTVQADRLVIVIIDDLHIWKGRTDKARALAADVVTNLGAQASMAVLFTSGEGSTEVTQDRGYLLAAIGGMQARQSFRRPNQGFPNPGPGFIDPAAPIEVRLDKLNDAAKVSLQERNDNLSLFGTVGKAAQVLLDEDRRRKAFVLISEGFQLRQSELAEIVSQEVDITGGLGREVMSGTIEAMRRANVALYAIDPRGKVRAEDMMLESWPPPDCAVCSSPPLQLRPEERAKPREDSQFAWDNPVRVAQTFLTNTARAAGGFAVTDTDDLTGGLSRILEDLDHYYLLGYYPTDVVDDSKPRTVGVSVPGHPGYKLRFRRGYAPEASPAPLKSKDPLGELSSSVMPRSDLPLRLTAMPLPASGKVASVAVALEVTAPVTLMKEADKKLRDDITYSVIVVDAKKARVSQRTGRSASFTLRATDPTRPEPDQVAYQIPLTIDLAPGRYQLRASAISRKLGKGGSVYLDLTVPDFSKAPLALTSIALGYAGGPRVPVGRTGSVAVPYRAGAGLMGQPAPDASPWTPPTMGSPVPPAQARAQNSKNPLPFEPTLSREFTSSDVLFSYFQVVRKDPDPIVALEIRIIDHRGVAQLTYDRIVDSVDGRIPLRIPLASLSPGAYVMRVVAGDGRNRATTETGFIVAR